MGYVGKKPTPVPLTSSDITNDIITEAKIADDAVENEHLNANVITGHTALAATPADTDELLISDAGTLKRIDYSYLKSDPTHVLLQTQTVSSAVAQVDFTSNIDSTYDIYMVDIVGVHPSVDSAQFDMRFFQGGTIVTSSIYDSATDNYRSNNTAHNMTGLQNYDKIRLAVDVDTNGSSTTNGRVMIYNASNTTYNTHVLSQFTTQGQGDYAFGGNCTGRIESTTAVDGFRFLFDSGNIESAIIKLYGVN